MPEIVARNGSGKMDAHRLKGLEGTVEEEVPNNIPVFKGGNVEDEEVAEHSQRGGERDPSRGHVDGGEKNTHERPRARIYSKVLSVCGRWCFGFVEDTFSSSPSPKVQKKNTSLHNTYKVKQEVSELRYQLPHTVTHAPTAYHNTDAVRWIASPGCHDDKGTRHHFHQHPEIWIRDKTFPR